MRYADSNCACEEVYTPKHMYIFTGKCIVTKKIVSVAVPAKELFAYRQGALMQHAMPSLSAADREFLMSGTSEEGWNRIFGKEPKFF
jgi:hypothetical protein